MPLELSYAHLEGPFTTGRVISSSGGGRWRPPEAVGVLPPPRHRSFSLAADDGQTMPHVHGRRVPRVPTVVSRANTRRQRRDNQRRGQLRRRGDVVGLDTDVSRGPCGLE